MLVAGGTWVQGMVGKRARVRAYFRVTQKAGGLAATTVKLVRRMSEESSQNNPPRDDHVDGQELPRPTSLTAPMMPDLMKLKETLVAAISAAFDQSPPRPEDSTKAPAKRTADSEPSKGGKK